MAEDPSSVVKSFLVAPGYRQANIRSADSCRRGALATLAKQELKRD